MKKFKLPQRTLILLVPLLLSFFMSSIVSFISIINSQGISSFQLDIWFYSWMASWMIAFPSVFILLPMVRKMASYIVVENKLGS